MAEFSPEQLADWGETLANQEHFSPVVKIEPDSGLAKAPIVGPLVKRIGTETVEPIRYSTSRQDAQDIAEKYAEVESQKPENKGKKITPGVKPASRLTF